MERIIVSDVHLGPDASSEARGGAFAAFLHRLAAEAEPPRLVLLGDILDLPNHVAGTGPRAPAILAWEDAALQALAAILARHPALAGGLAALAARGAGIDLVPGNHDLVLARPRVRAALEAVTGPLAVHPWILHVPGVLYTEHGQQYHDLASVPTLVDPDPRGGAPGAPPAWALERMVAGGPLDALAGLAALATGAVRTHARLGRIQHERSAYRERLAAVDGVVPGLPGELLARIDALAVTTPLRTATGALQRIVGRRRRDPGAGSPAAYLLPAARSIAALLAEHGLGVPLLVFGHTHAPALEPLGGDAAAPRYANPGTWGRLRPAAVAKRVGPDRHPYLVVEDGAAGGPPHAGLRLWNAVHGRDEPYAPATGD